MALITDINTEGASAQTITVRTSMMQILINGTWNGATVSLQKLLPDDSWVTVQSWVNSAYDIVETVGSAKYRFSTVQGGSAPNLKCDVVAPGWIPSV